MSRSALHRARLLRGLVVAATGVLLAVGGHLLAGGTLSASPALLVLVTLAAGACTLWSYRQWSFARLLVALCGVQLLVHEAMNLGMGPGLAAGHVADTPFSASPATGAGGWLMVAAHAGATAVTAWLLRQGEALIWRLVERLRPRPLWPTVTAPLDLSAPTASSTGSSATWLLVPMAGSQTRRGPPSPFFA